MRKLKFTISIVVLFIAVAYAFGAVSFKPEEINKKPINERTHYVDTYFVFNGASASEYTDSTKWTRHETNPSAKCDGGSLACKIRSATLSTKSALVVYINAQGINGPSVTIMAQKP